MILLEVYKYFFSFTFIKFIKQNIYKEEDVEVNKLEQNKNDLASSEKNIKKDIFEDEMDLLNDKKDIFEYYDIFDDLNDKKKTKKRLSSEIKKDFDLKMIIQNFEKNEQLITEIYNDNNDLIKRITNNQNKINDLKKENQKTKKMLLFYIQNNKDNIFKGESDSIILESSNNIQKGEENKNQAEQNTLNENPFKKTPKKPKKALSSYMIFFKSKKEHLKNENPNLPFSELSEIISDIWERLDPSLKEPYENESDLDQQRYRKEKEEYNNFIKKKKKNFDEEYI